MKPNSQLRGAVLAVVCLALLLVPPAGYGRSEIPRKILSFECLIVSANLVVRGGGMKPVPNPAMFPATAFKVIEPIKGPRVDVISVGWHEEGLLGDWLLFLTPSQWPDSYPLSVFAVDEAIPLGPLDNPQVITMDFNVVSGTDAILRAARHAASSLPVEQVPDNII